MKQHCKRVSKGGNWLLCFLILICIALFLLTIMFGSTASSTEEILEVIAAKEGVTDSSTMHMLGTVKSGDKILVCAMAEDQYGNRKYFAAEFKQHNTWYHYVHNYYAVERGADCYALHWCNGYVFMSNNEALKSLQLNFSSDIIESTTIQVEEVPFVYFLDLSSIEAGSNSFKYNFLDKFGNDIT